MMAVLRVRTRGVFHRLIATRLEYGWSRIRLCSIQLCVRHQYVVKT